MKVFAKKKKNVLLLLSFLLSFAFAFILILFSFSTVLAQDCLSDCYMCTDKTACENISLARCEWDGSLSKCCYILQTDWPVSPMGTNLTSCSTLPQLVKYTYEWGILIGGLIAFFSLILSGFQYLTSIGDPQKIKDARNRIMGALGGLILLLGSWLILDTINPDLTKFKNIIFDPDAIPDSDFEMGGVPKEPPCDYVLLYKEKKYEGDATVFGYDYDENSYSVTVGLENFKSVQSFKRCKPIIYEENEGLIDSDKLIEDYVELLNPLNPIPINDSQRYYKVLPPYAPPDTNTYYSVNCKFELGDPGKVDPDFYEPGGACSLQFMESSAWYVFWDPCGELISQAYAQHPGIHEISDKQVRCIKVIKHNPDEF
jgi:hypothetical protein